MMLTSRFADVPYWDLNDDAARQSVVDREPGQYLGHPTLALLPDQKTLLTVYPKGHGSGAILMKRSTDGGRTWSDRLPTPPSWTTSKETPTIHLIKNPATGKPRLLLWSGLNPARFSISDDLGATWTELKPAGDWGGIVVMSALEQLPGGRIGAMFHDDGRFLRPGGRAQGVFTLFTTESMDGGESWSEPKPIWSGSDLHLCEPGLITSPGGEVRAALLRENRRVSTSHAIFSWDRGGTWSAPRPMHASLTGDRHTGVEIQPGVWFISFRDMAEGSPTKGDWVAWVGTWDDVVAGRPGQLRIRLKDNLNSWDCGYPGVQLMPDGTVIAVTYGYWTAGEQPYVMSVRLSTAEILSAARIGAAAPARS